VAPHILHSHQNLPVRAAPRGGVQRAREPGQRLERRQVLRRPPDALGAGLHFDRGAHDRARNQVEQSEALDAADATAGAAGERSPPGLQDLEGLLDQRQLYLGAVLVHPDLEVDDLAAGAHQPLGQRETHGQGFELARRGHHHRMRDAVEDQRDRPLLRHAVGGEGLRAISVARHADFNIALGFVPLWRGLSSLLGGA
jgi:hypothetical protein